MAFDLIVVGAGSAGCVLAARLAAAGRRVLLIEAGPVHPFEADLPASQGPVSRLADGLATEQQQRPATAASAG